VRIPRTNMMMAIAEVTKDGKFELKANPKVLYTTMMLIRTSIVLDCPLGSIHSLLIALRYGSVRRQFATIKGVKSERKIIDYQTFQSTLTPLLAVAMAQTVVGRYIREEFRKLQE
jgi:acyl-CoA oxidase